MNKGRLKEKELEKVIGGAAPPAPRHTGPIIDGRIEINPEKKEYKVICSRCRKELNPGRIYSRYEIEDFMIRLRVKNVKCNCGYGTWQKVLLPPQ